MTAEELPQFVLQFVRRGVIKKNGKWEEVAGRVDELDPNPTLYSPLTGDYVTVANRATKLNEMQLRSSYLDYLFFADYPPLAVV